jgi:cleavage and polyadenylation specificity factor subunit 1
VHIDIVGPLRTSDGWPEAIPLQDITAEKVARALSPDGYTVTDAIDQGRQFESQIFHSLTNMCGIHLSRKTFHSAADGLVERIHRSLKAAIMCQAEERWTKALPLALLGIRTAFKWTCSRQWPSSSTENHWESHANFWQHLPPPDSLRSS